jgi:AcrR family transcriptional regulator
MFGSRAGLHYPRSKLCTRISRLENFVVPDMKVRERDGGYLRGKEGIEQILKAALWLLVEHGSKALTMRRIAERCGMNVGNLTYYFKSKQDLIRELLDAVISAYEHSFETIIHEGGANAETRLALLIDLILQDITTKKTTRFFPELWVMAGHDAFVQERMEDLYQRARVSLNELIAEINPALPDDEREILALFISASMEGLTVFAGYEKPWRPRMPWLMAIARRSFVDLARDLKPGEIQRLAGADTA